MPATLSVGIFLHISGSFSVSSAYSLSPDLGKVTNNKWGIIRKIKAPQRCIVFLWLAIQNCFMTVVERNRRGLTSNVYCPIFLSHLEITLHVPCDSEDALLVWRSLVGSDRQNHVKNLTMHEWFIGNL